MRIKAALREVKDKAKPGDFIVLFLGRPRGPASGGKSWAFLPHDFDKENAAETVIWDTELLKAADALAEQGHDVLLAVESCYSGMLITKAQELGLIGAGRTKKKGRGALVVATSCKPSQVSTASTLDEPDQLTGWFSTALREGLSGKADADRDGVVTLTELRGFLEAQLWAITHKQFKEPGLAGPAQDSRCLGSPEAPEGLEIVRADRKVGLTPKQVLDEDFVPNGPDLFADLRKGSAPVGTWKATKCEVERQGKKFEQRLGGDYTLTIRADGTYTASLTDSKGRTQKTEGKYEYKTGPVGKFVLIFSGGRDELHHFGKTDDWMRVRVQCDSHNQVYETFYELERLKD